MCMKELMDAYREQGAPQDQQMLIALLREIQDQSGGVLSEEALEAVAQAYEIRQTLLLALIRRVPSLRLQQAPHRLELCVSCPKGRELRAWVERTWRIKPGDCCPSAGFCYRTVPCLHNCANGPSLRWDGQLYSNATKELILRLAQGRK